MPDCELTATTNPPRHSHTPPKSCPATDPRRGQPAPDAAPDGVTHLPVDDVLPALHEALDRGPAVLHAPTGAGKTTRVPPALLDRVAGRVLVLEPRRVAARAAARRMAAERREKVGQTVGYRVRLDDRSGPATRLLVITDGILLGMLHSDPLLDGVDAVVFDEFHERRLDCDLALALMKELRELRPELLLVVMSATLDAEPVSRWLDGTVVRSSGRLHPVDTQYLPHASAAPLPTQVASAIRRALDKADGDILAFLPGVREIHRTATALGAVAGWEVLPLHGRLPAAEQDRAMAAGGRRIVLATNVAETSVTLPGVTTVVDAGWVKRLRVDPSTGLDRLVTERISKASADQRAGRAGRVRPGRCSRLWTAREHAQLAPFEEPEIRRVDLCGAALHVLRWGTAPDRLAWFEAPPPASLAGALTTLQELGLIDGGLTELGAVVARIPAHPRIARMLVEAHATGALPQAAAVAALLSDRDPVGRCPATHTAAADLAD
ncbi:MAG: ATP-dependent helicase HrpB, partial [Myxococcota bacterium]